MRDMSLQYLDNECRGPENSGKIGPLSKASIDFDDSHVKSSDFFRTIISERCAARIGEIKFGCGRAPESWPDKSASAI
ncbi:hypothetical protein QG37_01357 [Candidozyma auris]|nr:hypothetical protein QG37_01357 [[Candida] auris]